MHKDSALGSWANTERRRTFEQDLHIVEHVSAVRLDKLGDVACIKVHPRHVHPPPRIELVILEGLVGVIDDHRDDAGGSGHAALREASV